MNKDKLKLLIIILILFAIVIIGIIAVLGLQKENNYNNLPNDNNINNINIAENYIYDEEETQADELEEVKDKSMLNSLNNNINQYFKYIKEGNIDAVNELGGNNFYEINNNAKYVLNSAKVKKGDYQEIYYTYGVLTIANGDLTAVEYEIYMILYLDYNNYYYLKTITEEEFYLLENIEYAEILKGNYNIFEYEEVTDLDLMKIYLEDYTFRIFNNTQESYELLDEEYKTKRFATIDVFMNFLMEKQTQLANIELIQYNSYNKDNYTIYVGTDENGNYYKIKEYGYMSYTIMLDNYTVQEDYSGESDEEKTKKAVETFISMINSANYSGAYNLLEPTFRVTYFPTEEDFKNYIKSNWFQRNIIASKEITEIGTCIVLMRESIATTSNKMEKEFIVILGGGMDFAIQFNM